MKTLGFCLALSFCYISSINDNKASAINLLAKPMLPMPERYILMQYVSRYGVKGNQLSKINLHISFNSGEKAGASFYKYNFKYNKWKCTFLSTHNKLTDRKIYLNNAKASIWREKNKYLNINSMNLDILYEESEIYTFKKNPYCLLIVSHPMNWVGQMAKYSFFQLMDLKEKKVIEFIEELKSS